jgi:hypothetical protein
MSYRDYRIVLVTPSGRQRYMTLLERHIEAASIRRLSFSVDEWQIWVNTNDVDDLQYLRHLSERRPFVRLIEGVGNPELANKNIRNYYRFAVEPDTVFIRTDDDIVWLAPDFFQRLIDSRLANPDPLLVSANVINNAICGHLQQRAGAFGFDAGTVGYTCMDPVGWKDPHHAEYVHRAFLANPNADRWRTQDWLLYAGERFSINAICWFGEEMAKIIKAGGVGEDEEDWLTYQYPRQSKQPNMICGSAVAVHFAFFTQRAHLDKTDVLDGYRKLAGLT